jgi:hypothetical protein
MSSGKRIFLNGINVVALVPYGHAGSKMVQELLSFTKQEKEMEECASLDV